MGLKHVRGVNKAVFILEIELCIARHTLTEQKHA
jgi:hypothetical protein